MRTSNQPAMLAESAEPRLGVLAAGGSSPSNTPSPVRSPADLLGQLGWADDTDQLVRSIALVGVRTSDLDLSTATALAFAAVNAASGPILIIDANHRAPRLHRKMRSSLAPGLTDVLQGQREPDEVIRRSGTESIDVLTAGKRDTQLLRKPNDQWPSLLDWTVQRYSLTLITLPSLERPAPIHRCLSPVDATVLVADRYARLSDAKRAKAAARQAGIQLSAMVFGQG